MLLGTDERLEEPPSPPGRQPENLDVVRRELLRRRFGRRQADRSCDGGRQQPQDEERRGDQSRTRLESQNQNCGDCRDGDGARHLPVGPADVEVGSGLGLRTRRPLKQVPSGGVDARQRS